MRSILRWIWLPFLKWRLARLERRLPVYEARLRHGNRKGAIIAISYLTVNWAVVETILDWNNLAISRKLPKREPFPIALGRKLEMFRRGHNKLAELAALQKDGAALADLIAAASVRRHDLIHGMGTNTLGEEIVEFIRHRVPREPDRAHTMVMERKPYSQDAIWDAADETFGIINKMLYHTKALIMAVLTEDEADDFRRQIGI